MDEKKILVAGAGISGIDSAKLISRNGGSVILFDENKKGALTEEGLRERLGEEYKDKSINIVLGEYTEEININNLPILNKLTGKTYEGIYDGSGGTFICPEADADLLDYYYGVIN